jgi:CTP synthase (UTP-ammonia lyase)
MAPLRIGLIGDHDPAVLAHRAIPAALRLAAEGLELEAEWIPTPDIDPHDPTRLADYHGLWCVPASPYASAEGALAAIRFARERSIPFLGTCGGFQHALLEYARNVLGIAGDHAETSPEADLPVISRLSCSLVEERGTILVESDSLAGRLYEKSRVVEGYHCSYGLNPDFEDRLSDRRLRFTGRDEAGEVRIAELSGHSFYLATLYQPERSALRGEIHPLIRGFVQAARSRLEQQKRCTGLTSEA